MWIRLRIRIRIRNTEGKYSKTHFTKPFLNRLVSSRASPLSLQYQAASRSQAMLKSCWALYPLDTHLGHPLGDALGPEGGGVVECEIGVAGGGEGRIRHRRHIRPVPGKDNSVR